MSLNKMAVSPEQQRKKTIVQNAGSSSAAAASASVNQEETFAQADLLLFKEKKYLEAENLYRQIIATEE